MLSRDRQFLHRDPESISPKTNLLTPISYHLNHSREKLAPQESMQKVQNVYQSTYGADRNGNRM